MHNTLSLLTPIALAACLTITTQSVVAQTAQPNAASAPRSAPLNLFDPAVLNNLAVAKARRGEFAEAQTLLERALRLTPKYPEVQQNRDRLTEWVALTGGSAQPKPTQPVANSLRSMPTASAPPPPLWPITESR